MPGPDQQKPVALPEMLQGLARERATGVLTVRGREGWKVLEARAGSITLVSRASGKRMRLGEILLARGKITADILAKALEAHRASGIPLGEVLAQDGYISRSDIQDIVRFQVEEEIYDLFTWKDARCTFEANTALGEQIEGYPEAARLSIDPQKVFVEAARRIPLWQRIEGKISSAHVIYRLTDRGESMHRTATRGGRKLLDLVKQGYCVDIIVRKAMVGRFAIWKALADLVDAQAVAAIPDAEIAGLCDGWEAEGKLEQALGACLRIAEGTKDPQKLAALQARAEAMRREIHQKEHRKLVEARVGLEKKSSYRPIVVLSVLVALVFVALFLPALVVIRRVDDTKVFVGAQERVDKLKEQRNKHEAELAETLGTAEATSDPQKLEELQARAKSLRHEMARVIEEAIEIWIRFLADYPDGINADLATSARDLAEEDYEKLVNAEIARAQELEKAESFGEAITVYDDILRIFSRTRSHTRISDMREEAKKKRNAKRERATREKLATWFENASALIEEKRYSPALIILQDIEGSTHAGVELRGKAREKLQVIEEVEGKARALLAAARAREDADDRDGALELYEECQKQWRNTSSGKLAVERAGTLTHERERVAGLCEAAIRHYAKGEFIKADGNLKEAAGIGGWKVTRVARQRLEKMKTADKRAAELLADAKRLRIAGKLDEAFEKQVEILKIDPRPAAARDLVLEVSIETVPVGATVLHNGEDIGSTPRPVRLPPWESGVLVLRKPGFVTLKEKYKDVRKRVLRYHLQKELAFRKGVGQPVRSSAVPGAGGRFFVHAGKLLAAYSSDRGKPLWQVTAGPASSARAHPSVLEETVFIASGGRLRAFSVSGEPRFEIALGLRAATSPAALKLRLVANRPFAIVGCMDGSVVSLDLVGRSPRWTMRVTPPLRFDLAVSEKAVFVPSSEGTISAFDVRSGKRLWTGNVSGEVACNIAFDRAADLVGALSSLGEVFVFSASDGVVRMRATLAGVRGGGMVIADGEIFVGGDDGKLRALDIDTGRELWSPPLSVGAPVRDSPAVHGGMVYVGTEGGHLICVGRGSGREEWRFDANSPITAAPTIIEGLLIFGTEEGEIFGLKVKTAGR